MTPTRLGIGQAPKQRYVLFLRTFGNDGGVHIGNPASGPGFRKRTLEWHLCRVVGESGLASFAFHDRSAKKVPDGLAYYLSDHEDWKRQFRRRARRASAVVAITTGTKGLGESFLWELKELSGALDQKVILVSSPDLSRRSHRSKEEACRALDWPVPQAKFLVAYRRDDGRLALQLSLGPEDPGLANAYESSFRQALRDVTAR